MSERKGHPLKDAIRQDIAASNQAYDADFARRDQVIKDSVSELGKELKSQGVRFLTELGDQLSHTLGHGSSELASLLSTGSAFVQYGANPADVALGELEAPKIEAPRQDEPKKSMSL